MQVHKYLPGIDILLLPTVVRTYERYVLPLFTAPPIYISFPASCVAVSLREGLQTRAVSDHHLLGSLRGCGTMVENLPGLLLNGEPVNAALRYHPRHYPHETVGSQYCF